MKNEDEKSWCNMKKIISCILTMVLLASAVPMVITSVAAYEKKIPCDADENDELTKDELVSAICSYMLAEEGAHTLDEVGDAAYVYVHWNGERMTVVDQADRTVTLYRPVERVVLADLLDGVRTLVQLGAADKIVATNFFVKNYALNPPASHPWSPVLRAAPELDELPSVGMYNDPGKELIVPLDPDMIFTYAGVPEVADTLQESTGIPAVCIVGSGDSFLDFNTHKLVGKVIGKEERAEELISYANEKIDEVAEVTSQLKEKPRVYAVSGCSGKAEITKTWGRYDPINLAGGINVAEEYVISSGSTIVSKEHIIDWNPDIILIHGVFPPHAISIDDVLSDPDLQTVNAVKNESVNYTKGYMIGWDPATGLTEVFYLAKLFNSEEFENLDEEEEGNEILEKFYGVGGLYTDMLDLSDRYRWE
jgi:iron complex transport system substrate-binding protein